MEHHITLPLKDEDIEKLNIGDRVYLSGVLYTARDAAHGRMQEALDRGQELPFSVKGSVIYYMGPSPARPGRPIGSAGPTTASRMDRYAPALLDIGLKGMVGKGKRSDAVREAVIRNGAVYFAAIGGAGALLSKAITQSEVVAYEDLGTEAVRKLTVEDFPVIVVMDRNGNDLYKTAPEEYRK
ncbi:MAG: Fe-S-containing hydro-lyase [Lachnospiraceae bacterium]|nr:Fe-S-containing hydro-lyase [Lachnospiraceae bacterium]